MYQLLGIIIEGKKLRRMLRGREMSKLRCLGRIKTELKEAYAQTDDAQDMVK